MFSGSSSTLAGTGPATRISNSTTAMFSTPTPDDHVPFSRRSHLTGAAGSSEPGGNRDPSPCPDCPYPWAALGVPGTLRGVVSAAEQGEPSMGDQVPGRLRLRRRRRLFLRVRAPSSAADRGCSRPGDPGQRRSRLRVLGRVASRRGAAPLPAGWDGAVGARLNMCGPNISGGGRDRQRPAGVLVRGAGRGDDQ